MSLEIVRLRASEYSGAEYDHYELFFVNGKINDVCFYKGNYSGGSLVIGHDTTPEKELLKALENISKFQREHDSKIYETNIELLKIKEQINKLEIL